MRDVAITVSLSHYTATVHYLDCNYYTGYLTHINQTIPPSIKMKMCVWCKPTAEDVVEIAGDIKWLEKYADAFNRVIASPQTFEVIEEIVGRDQMTGGRTLARRTKYD